MTDQRDVAEDQSGAGAAVERDLAELREMVASARSMPMSASCVVNRADTLALIDKVMAGLPAQLAQARRLLDTSAEQVRAAEDERDRIVGEAREQAAELVSESGIARQAREEAERLRAEAEDETTALRRETDAYVDERMAGFESVLAKTMTQVRTARHRLSERSHLDDPAEG